MSWKEIKKIDAHIHILPEEKRLEFIKYQGEECTWARADIETYINLMDEAPYELEYAIKELGLHGLKLHPSNLAMDADDLRLVPVLRKAAELKVPVMYHSNPCMMGFHDNCAPDKINKMIMVFPDIQFITAHMGGMKYLDAWSGCTWVDISFVLPEFVELYGMEQTNRILRIFGADRLIFGTDYPEREYELYCSILDKMDFTEEEKRKIAYENINSFLLMEK